MPIRVPFTQLHDSSGRFTQSNQGLLWTGLRVVAENINKRGNTLNESRKKAMEKLGADMQDYARRNAPWQDRSGDARDSLVVVVTHSERDQSSTAALSHQVPYGLWLEIMQGGRFAIIGPTIQEYSKKIVSTVIEFDTVDAALARAGFG